MTPKRSRHTAECIAPTPPQPVSAQIVADGPLAESEEAVFRAFAAFCPLKSLTVLELGGAVPLPLLQGREVRAWYAIDRRHLRAGPAGPRCPVVGRAEALPFTDCSVDAVFSSNALQFMDAFAVLAEAWRVLRPGGVVYTHFGPIWSGPDGHQLEYLTWAGRDLVFWRDPLLPPYAHLMYDRSELAAILRTAIPEELVELLVWHVYDSDTVNRLFFEDYASALADSGLECVELVGSTFLDYEIAPPPYAHPLRRQPDLDEIARRVGPGAPRALGVRDVRLVARKRH